MFLCGDCISYCYSQRYCLNRLSLLSKSSSTLRTDWLKTYWSSWFDEGKHDVHLRERMEWKGEKEGAGVSLSFSYDSLIISSDSVYFVSRIDLVDYWIDFTLLHSLPRWFCDALNQWKSWSSRAFHPINVSNPREHLLHFSFIALQARATSWLFVKHLWMQKLFIPSPGSSITELYWKMDGWCFTYTSYRYDLR